MKKKIKDKFEEKLEQDLEQYFDNTEVPELNNEKQEELKKLVSQNKTKRKRIPMWKKITAAASTLCLIALIIIPTILFLNKTDNPQNLQNTPPVTPPIYYGKAEATKIPHTIEETQEIINKNFPKYNFMFTDLTYVSAKGYYNPNNNTLLALQIYFNESKIPYTQVEIHIIASKQFVFDNQEIYTKDSQYTKTENYDLYKIIYQDPFSEFERGYVIFHNHEIYINLARINEELFNKFI